MAKIDPKKLDLNLGIVISDWEINLLEGKTKGDKFTVLKAAREPIKETQFVERGRIIHENALVLKLRQMIDELNPSSSCASINVPSCLTFMKNIPTEKDLVEKFSDWIEWEASEQILYPIREFQTSQVPLNATTSDGDLRLICSVNKKILRERIKLIESLDFFPISADPDTVAIYNGFVAFAQQEENLNYLFIDIPLPTYSFFATFNGKFVFGGTKYTSLDYRDLELGKPPQVLFESLAKEIHENSIQLFESYGDFPQNADGIIITGFLSASEPLKKAMKNYFLPTILSNIPYDKKLLKFKIGKEFIANWPVYIKAGGLALRKAIE